MSQDKAETGRLEELLARVGAGLDQFLKFEHPDAYTRKERWRSALERPAPQQGVGIDAVVDELMEQVVPNGSSVGRPGFTAYITTGGTSASTLASTAASIAAPQRYMGTAFNLLEGLSLDWIAQICGLGNMKGVYSSGGSVANLLALGAARQSAFENIGRDPASDGVDRAVSVYASDECHNTIQRAAGILGIGRRSVIAIGCDKEGRMRDDLLRTAIEADLAADILPMAIVASAGTTNSGAIDPLQAIGAIAQEFGIWYHVDGAYGLPGILDPRVSHLFEGLELVDSVVVDPHKWLGAAVGVAATFVRDRGFLERAFTQGAADYLEGSIDQSGEANPHVEHSMDDFGVPYFNYGVELSAPCRGVMVWALIREIGVEGLRARIIRHNDMAREVADVCRQHARLELLLEPTLSICCFRYVPSVTADLDRLNQQILRRLIRENEFMPSSTRINGQLALRPCFIGARTERSQIDGLMQAIVRIGDTLMTEEL